MFKIVNRFALQTTNNNIKNKNKTFDFDISETNETT